MPELSKTYSPAEVEPDVAQRWDEAGAFDAEPDAPGTPYCIVIPPPNVTAALHMGHALNNTLQDILVRWRRMCGDNTLWMPGTDHAGIATQTVVEKRVLADEGKRRTDFERDEFVGRIQSWKDEYEAQITGQLKAMGCSCDWRRQRFTMDPVCARAVREAFFRMFRDDLIYRGKRLVNWDPATQTALADDEVEMRDIDGHFWYMKYPVVEAGGDETGEFVTVATTRPETMLGDTAVAVNPADPRAPGLRGKSARLPIVNRIVPIIEDDYVVLPDPDGDEKARYSSGFLKVTPAHDPNDYEIGQRFELAIINVMAPDGTISDQHGWPQEDFARGDAGFVLGLDRFEAREAVVDWFRAQDLLEDVKPYRHSVGHSYRSHVPIEPYLSDQWYVKVADERLAGAALDAMEPAQVAESDGPVWADGPRAARKPASARRLQFTPARYARTFQNWHENIRDWCISRQLWWGHRIPVWSRDADQGDAAALVGDAVSSGAAAVARFGDRDYVCPAPGDQESALQARLEQEGFEQDPDVLDTWFSSALWPFSTLGWPEPGGALETWNPGNVLCTAREIITLWVSRMVMTNLYLLDRLPFTDVFIHAMIQDGEGRKMSKSLGNGVDPLDIIHSHGADAMRFTLASMTTNTQDVRMPVRHDAETGRNTSEKFDIGRNLANKLWNAVRFALDRIEGGAASDGTSFGRSDLSLADRWILSRLAKAVAATDGALTQYEFSQYAQGMYDFFWRDLCDWYIEAVKPTVGDCAAQQRVLATCLDVVLRLLHPSMPFISERLWQRLDEVAPQRGVEGVDVPAHPLLVRAAWPKVSVDQLVDDDVEGAFTMLQEWVSALREMRTSHQVPPRERMHYVADTTADVAAVWASLAPYAETFANAEAAHVGPNPPDSPEGLSLIATAQIGDATVRAFRAGAVGADREAELERLNKRLEQLRKSAENLNKRLSNPGYTEKAPEKLVQQTRDQLAETEQQIKAIEDQMRDLEQA
ncbi:MAG: valine--tRNA ligase [Phycisphaeraceae bacterium]|nr:valine--tRNA ligase [Phycisphaeraceae bacterium]